MGQSKEKRSQRKIAKFQPRNRGQKTNLWLSRVIKSIRQKQVSKVWSARAQE